MSNFYESDAYDESVDEYNFIKGISEPDDDEVVDATYEINEDEDGLWDEVREDEDVDLDSDISDEDDDIDSDNFQDDKDDFDEED